MSKERLGPLRENWGTLTGSLVTNVLGAFNGSVVETIDIEVIEDTGAVKLQLQQSGTGDLTFLFGGAQYVLDCTPVQEVTLTAGTDIAPQINYVYVTESGGVLTLAKSTSSFPATAHAPIATVMVQSAASLATDGAYKVHAWTDHLSKSTENGHISHLNAKIRALNATWVSGVAPSDITSGQFNTTAGVVYQLHTHTMAARDMASSDPVFVVNDPDTAYKRITDMDAGGIAKLSDGTALGNNKYLNLVVWGVVSEKSADCKLYINLPDAQYTTEADAQSDTDSSADYSFAANFVGTAFLIARYTVKYATAGGGTITQSQKTDLRGLFPSTAVGGAAGSGNTNYLIQASEPTTFAGLLWFDTTADQLKLRDDTDTWWEIIWPAIEADRLSVRFNGDASISSTLDDGIAWTYANTI